MEKFVSYFSIEEKENQLKTNNFVLHFQQDKSSVDQQMMQYFWFLSHLMKVKKNAHC
jgi:hypothetical protein